jgi:hypothetical protein
MFRSNRRTTSDAPTLGTLRAREAQDRKARERQVRIENIERQMKKDAPVREAIKSAAIKGADVAATIASHPVLSSALPSAIGGAASVYKHFAPTGSIYHSKQSFTEKALTFAKDVAIAGLISRGLKTLGGISSGRDEAIANAVRPAGSPAPRAPAPMPRAPTPAARTPDPRSLVNTPAPTPNPRSLVNTPAMSRRASVAPAPRAGQSATQRALARARTAPSIW